VTDAEFDAQVLKSDKPVLVDFWAEWCGPCKALSPALEKAANSRQGKVELAKVDVDKNQMLAQTFGVRGIPAVKAFRDARIVDEFTGAIPPDQVERFFDRLVPSEADELAGGDDEESLRRALELEPSHPDAAVALARILLERGELDEAAELLEPLRHDFRAAGMLARVELARQGREPEAAFEAWDAGDYERALELLQEALTSASDATERDLLRKVMVAIFTELGPDSELASRHRRRLASALN
jgi:putative thioredoxin